MKCDLKYIAETGLVQMKEREYLFSICITDSKGNMSPRQRIAFHFKTENESFT